MNASPPLAASPGPAAAPPGLARRAWVAVERLAVSHFAGYPIAFLWAVAAIPLTIHLSARILDQIGDLDQIGKFVVRRLAYPAGTAFVLAHATAIPWIVAKDPKAGLRRTLLALGGLAGIGIVVGAASWLWLVLR